MSGARPLNLDTITLAFGFVAASLLLGIAGVIFIAVLFIGLALYVDADIVTTMALLGLANFVLLLIGLVFFWVAKGYIERRWHRIFFGVVLLVGGTLFAPTRVISFAALAATGLGAICGLIFGGHRT